MPGGELLSREELTKRSIPNIKFSTESNPLTAPPVFRSGLSAAQRAAARFAVKGNVIGERDHSSISIWHEYLSLMYDGRVQ